MATSGIKWYWNRLRRMSLPETGYRLCNIAYANLQRFGLMTAARVPSPDNKAESIPWLTVPSQLSPVPYQRVAGGVLDGKFRVFAMSAANIGHPPEWNRDPRSGTQAPLAFGKSLNYRDPAVVGDIKYLWEPNRHLQLVSLAQAYRLCGEKRYLDGIAVQLDSWLDQCPYLKGPNWTSSLELAIRLINWSAVWHLVGGWNSPMFDKTDGTRLRARWLDSIYQHAHFIRYHFSLYSSANNHLLGEAAGLFIAAVTWPCWPAMSQHREKAQSVLVHEVSKQNFADGVNREQAVSYQQFVLDFALIAGLAGRANGIKFPSSYWRRLEAMLEYLASIMDVGGNTPMIGDADDGYVLRLSPDESDCPYRSLLATGAILFERSDFRAKSGSLDYKTRWLLGDDCEGRYKSIEPGSPTLPVRTAFPEAGYFILGSEFETDREIRLLVDAGPLGYLSLAAHGHADALALTLSVAGEEILIDPGTFAYHTGKKWRDYFRGTAAHNTVRVDEVDQSEPAGNFMWSHHAQASCVNWDSGAKLDRFAGMHDGYRRLEDPVIHRREIVLHKGDRRIVVTDILECSDMHFAERHWHFSEECDVQSDGGSITATRSGVEVRFRNLEPAGIDSDLVQGQDSPPLGWVSRRFDVKTPSASVTWGSSIQGTTKLVTEIICS